MTLLSCTACGRTLQGRDLFCSFCGTTTPASRLECEKHFGERAIGVCSVCGRPVCGDCVVTVEKVLYCNDADHRTMRESWTVIFTTRSEFEADAVYRNLEYAGIKARVFTMREHVAVFWFDEFAIVRVLVRQDDRERALSILSELQLIHDSEDE